MREIKFRAWDKIHKEMLPNGNGIDVLYILSTSGGSNEEYEFMQYIGLKDKKGKEIYEGDIIVSYYIHFEHDGVNFEVSCHKSEYKNKACSHLKVEYSDDSAMFLGVATSKMMLNQAHMNTWQIIGNIYENPELLKENNE